MIETLVHPIPRETASPGGIWSRPYRRLTLGLTLTVGAMAFESLSVAATMPATVRDLGGLALYGWAFSAYMLATLVGLTVAGSEADRSGPLRPFLGGVALFALGLLLAGGAPTMPVLIAGRAVQGLGAGLASAVAYVAVGRGYPEALRPRMLALTSSAYALPSLVGPALAGLVAEHLGWRWVFLGLAPLLPLAAGLALPALRRLNGAGAAPRDWGRIGAAARLAAGTACVTIGLGNAPTLPLTVGLVGLGLALAVTALRHLVPTASAQAGGLRAALFIALLQGMAFFGVDAFVPLALTAVRGQSVAFAGLALTAATLAWIASAWLQARLAARLGRRALVGLGLAPIALGIGGVAATLHPGVPVLLAPLAWGLAGLGMGLVSPTLTLLALELAPAGQEGASTAAMQLAGVLGIALGTGLGGVIVGGVGAGARVTPASLAGQDLLMVGMLVIAVGLARRLPGRSRAAAEVR